MNVVGVVFADFESTFFGTQSRLREKLGDRAILAHTLSRVRRCVEITDWRLVVKPSDEALARAELQQAGLADQIAVLPFDDGRRVRRTLFRAARKWNLTAWRGGLANSTYFDEFVDPAAMLRVFAETKASAVMCADGHHAAVDPALLDGMVRHWRENAAEAAFVFSPTPPGLAGFLTTPRAMEELLEKQLPVGVLLTYRPEFPATDPVIHPTCYHVPARIAQTPMRFVADTTRACERLAAAFGRCGIDADAAAFCAWSAEDGHKFAGPLPHEIELELTTADPLPQTRLAVRDGFERVLTDFAALERLAAELAAYDDRLVVLAGHGDPLCHAEFPRVARILRDAGVSGIAVETTLLDLTDASIEALFATPIDVVLVRLDAQTAVTYAALHGADRFAEAVASVERLEAERRRRGQAQPLLTPALTKHSTNLAEMEPFFDEWIQRVGSAVIRGYNEFCGQLPADALLRAEPPVRGPCRRLARRLTLLADGRVARCGQDVRGEHPLGDWRRAGLREIWAGAELGRLREVHAKGGWGAEPLCGGCREWFRP